VLPALPGGKYSAAAARKVEAEPDQFEGHGVALQITQAPSLSGDRTLKATLLDSVPPGATT
jgi:hypothetical protein